MTKQQSLDSEAIASAAAPPRPWEWLALAASVVGLAGSLYLSLGMKLQACPLCLYQRTFLMGLVGILLVGLTRPRQAQPGFLTLLCLPLAVGGLGVAAFHVHLERSGVLECPPGVFGLGSAPQQSLASYLVVTVLMGIAMTRSSGGTTRRASSLAAAVLGILFAAAAVKSAPPLPPPPTGPYTKPLEGCRPPFRSQPTVSDIK